MPPSSGWTALSRGEPRSRSVAEPDLPVGHAAAHHAGVVSGIILVFIPCLGSFLTPDLLGGANAVMIGNVIERQFKAAKSTGRSEGRCPSC